MSTVYGQTSFIDTFYSKVKLVSYRENLHTQRWAKNKKNIKHKIGKPVLQIGTRIW